MSKILEEAIGEEMLGHIQGCASDAATLLGLDLESPEEEIVKVVDECVHAWQKGDRLKLSEDDDPALTLGSLWGQQLVRKLSWQWAGVTFQEHDEAKAVGVFSPDRALAIYPFHFVFGCLENDAPVTIMLAFEMLVEGSRVPELPPNSYENVMDNVHHIVPRD